MARALLDRCDELFRDYAGLSLLDIILGQSGNGTDTDNSECEVPATYALQCALTAQLASLGIRLNVMVAHRAGLLAAAQTARMCTLEEGFRLAAGIGRVKKAQLNGSEPSTLSELEAALPIPKIATPTVPVINAYSGAQVESLPSAGIGDLLLQDRPSPEFSRCSKVLSEMGVDAALEIDLSSMATGSIRSGWPEVSEAPLVVSALEFVNDHNGTREPDASLLQAVSRLYEAGVDISFEGLFARRPVRG